MKTAKLFSNILLIILLLTAPVSPLLASDNDPGSPTEKETSFRVNTYLGPQWKLNLMMVVARPERITITLKDANNTVLYREIVSKGSRRYWRKFDFEQSEPGTYVFEITDGRQTVVRRVEIVDMPAVDAQRYLVYDTPPVR